MSIVNVIKRNGKREVYNCKKIKKAIAFACENLEVNPLQLEAKFDEFIKDGVTTASIQENLILHAKNLSSPTNDQWLLVAGRLATMGRWNDTRAYDVPFSVWYKKARTEGKWIHKQFEVYSDEDIEYFGTLIQKNRDLNHTIASVETAISKYLYPDECIQQMFMGEAMLYASVEPINTRRIKVLEWYTELSLLELSLATPHLMNLRQAKQVASCFILACNDNLDSIYRNIHNAARISKNGGGIGFFWGLVRAKGSMLMGESKASGGVLPFIKVLNDTLVAVNQRWKKKRSRYLCSSCMA